MNVTKLIPILVLCASVALGYWITSRACLDDSEPTATAQNVAVFDDTCSAASPDAVTCEMPEEISRADYFRLVGTSANTTSNSVVGSEEILAGSSTQSFNPAIILEKPLRQIKAKQKLERAFPMFAPPKKAE